MIKEFNKVEKEEKIEDRRKFLVSSTVTLSAACAIFPFASGIPALLDPIKENDAGNANIPWTKVTALSSLPEDGSPSRFEVVLEKPVCY